MPHDSDIQHKVYEGPIFKASIEQIIRENAEKYRQIIADTLNEKKEKPTMNVLKVSYRGFAGELIKLEARERIPILNAIPDMTQTSTYRYDLSIYDSEKRVTHSFANVSLDDVKFLCAEVHF